MKERIADDLGARDFDPAPILVRIVSKEETWYSKDGRYEIAEDKIEDPSGFREDLGWNSLLDILGKYHNSNDKCPAQLAEGSPGFQECLRVATCWIEKI